MSFKIKNFWTKKLNKTECILKSFKLNDISKRYEKFNQIIVLIDFINLISQSINKLLQSIDTIIIEMDICQKDHLTIKIFF